MAFNALFFKAYESSNLSSRAGLLTQQSTPKTTLFEAALFRKFDARCLATGADDEGVAFGVQKRMRHEIRHPTSQSRATQ